MPYTDMPNVLTEGVETENICINFPDNNPDANKQPTAHTKIIGLDLDIFGKTINFRINVQLTRVRLADIVPLARVVCEKVIDAALQKAAQNRDTVPCRPGCEACCHYLVPLSAPEAMCLADEFRTIPQPHRQIFRRLCLLAAKKILAKKPPENITNIETNQNPQSPDLLQSVSDWYRQFNLACPFLSAGLCDIRDKRPLVCRQYFVTGSEKACADQCGTTSRLEMPVHITEVLADLAAELENTTTEAVILPLVLAWSDSNQLRAERTWYAPEMVTRFAQLVKAHIERNAEIALTAS